MANASLTRTEVGIVGKAPGIVLMRSEDDYDAISTPGYINNIANFSEVDIRPTDFILATYPSSTDSSIFTDIFRATFNASIITLESIISGGGGGGAFPLENTVHVELGAVDGDGTAARPFGNFQDGVDALGSPSVPSLVLSQGVGTFDNNVTISSDNIFIFAPSAVLSPSSGDALTINASSASAINVTFSNINAPAANAVNITDAAAVSVEAKYISGNIQTNSAAGVALSISTFSLSGNITCNNASDTVQADVTRYTGTVTPANVNQVRGHLGQNYYGTSTFHGTLTPKRQSQTAFLGSTVLSDTFAGRLCSTNFGADGVITLPEDATEALPDGWSCQILRSTAFTVTFDTQGTDIIQGGITNIAFEGGRAFVTKVSSGIWNVSGDVSAALS